MELTIMLSLYKTSMVAVTHLIFSLEILP